MLRYKGACPVSASYFNMMHLYYVRVIVNDKLIIRTQFHLFHVNLKFFAFTNARFNVNKVAKMDDYSSIKDLWKLSIMGEYKY